MKKIVPFLSLFLILISVPAWSATRLYPQNASASVDPATERGAWDVNTGYAALPLSQNKAGAIASVGISESTATTDWDVLLLKLISDPLQAQTISGTVNLVLGAEESNTNQNAHWHVHIYVLRDTDTVVGTLLTDYTEAAGTNEWSTTAAGLGLNAAQTLTNVTTQANDRIVVEIGYVSRNNRTNAYTGTLWYGGTGGTDLASGGDETVNPGWIEFSADLSFMSTEARRRSFHMQ